MLTTDRQFRCIVASLVVPAIVHHVRPRSHQPRMDCAKVGSSSGWSESPSISVSGYIRSGGILRGHLTDSYCTNARTRAPILEPLEEASTAPSLETIRSKQHTSELAYLVCEMGNFDQCEQWQSRQQGACGEEAGPLSFDLGFCLCFFRRIRVRHNAG